MPPVKLSKQGCCIKSGLKTQPHWFIKKQYRAENGKNNQRELSKFGFDKKCFNYIVALILKLIII